MLLYGYATGVFSSGKIARKLPVDVAFRVLAARNFPAHRMIRDFRAFHLKALSDLFVQVVRLACEMGLVKLGTIAVDGTLLRRVQPTRPRSTNPNWTSRPRSRAAKTGSTPSPQSAPDWNS